MARVRVIVDLDVLPELGEDVEETVAELVADMENVGVNYGFVRQSGAIINPDEGDDGRAGVLGEEARFEIVEGGLSL